MSEFHHVPDVAGHLARARLAQAEVIADAVVFAWTRVAEFFAQVPAASNDAALALRRAWLRASA